MLRGLDIRDLLIIERLELEFQPGLNALTGETGAGKSILLDALGFALGWKGRADVLRPGAAHGEVTAVFDLAPGHPARAVLAEAGLPEGDELILRRIISREGRRTAFVNDRRTSGDVLRRIAETLVELHGQHDDRGLLNPRGHRALLDAFAGNAREREAVREAWRQLGQARQRLADAEADIARLAEEEGFLRHAVDELEKLAPQPGEEAELDSERRKLQAARRIGEDIARAHAALGHEGAERPMADALRWLEGVADRAEGALDEAIEALGRALDELGRAEQAVARAAESLEFDPARLEAVEERLFAIRSLARKHSVAPDDLPALGEELAARLSALEGGARDLAALRNAVAEAEAAYDAAAEALGATRRAAARRLDEAMAAELPPLKLERAMFRTEITPAEPGPEGCEAVSFTVSTAPGAPPGPISRIASGGELSRFLLALKLCLHGDDSGVTMIFDEIDRGVGGATADAVGRRLARLAQGGQVLVVTHSPQVAARAAHHFRVEKRLSERGVSSTVVALSPKERVDEIARMLAGDTVTEEARGAARALLAD
ncbi:DNA repair protein RecN (Recombination protein N) [Meinhardsimonia xiamenensis]|jgi:DNA repair protein RecN (Recombination protein N)|uniref:DNA repair protein RecN n=1 Tax=Meinhardsimonia xiamenensis TaxID=990712 RepID=A0A1G9CL24_9RHOB|nr:DNA repair protein RecN [Meinhardsimonia xiamenensis]PRX38322.1 DNA repair protein RecN (Recombination protein N) [Meinhardsimonia xiamenensis]SDK52393.1 DNA repair protein RecN (Recombination protein N) [Meinhardsimonia xiamenensis]